MSATQNNNAEMVQLLLESGVDIDAQKDVS
jgi:hypothetical protein